ncbi:MAG TPA: 50S ribosomal protein L11 methyltransferase [Bryobacteraceae bacterium]|nr:50S ribosomal protein L11 methyltransferase [Bryobacteraceae bacterium]
MATIDQADQATEVVATTLDPRTILQRVSPLRLTLESNGHVLLEQDGDENEPERFGPQALPILHAFAHPSTFSDALEALRPASLTGWMDLSSTALDLYRAGFLKVPGTASPPLESGFGSPEIHRRMLNDRTRTDRFRQAVREAVRPGDIVVEVGTGTGVLTLAALEAGASHVYTIEASAIADVAEEIFALAGVSDRVTVLRGWSTDVDVPERAHVVISEIIGNDPLGEGALQYLTDVRQRMALPDARFVPESLEVLAIPVTIPEELRQARAVTAEVIANWTAWYGASFAPVAARTGYHRRPLDWIKPQTAGAWPHLANPFSLLRFNFASSQPAPVAGQVCAEATTAGLWNGLLVCFVAGLGSTRCATTPAEAGSDNSWTSPLWYLENGLFVDTGDRLGLRFRYGSRDKGWSFHPSADSRDLETGRP